MSYFNFDDKEATVSCFRHEKDAKTYYDYLISKDYEHVAIDKCRVFTQFQWKKEEV